MHKSTLRNYFIKSLLKKHSIKKKKTHFVEPHYLLLSFNIFQRNFVPLFQNRKRKNLSQNVFNVIDHNKLFNGSHPATVRKKINMPGHFSSMSH